MSDALTAIPTELTLRVLSFLSAEQLAKVAEVSRAVRVLANEDLLWKWNVRHLSYQALCRRRWASKKHQQLTLHPFCDWARLSSKLTDEECHDILARRGVDVPGATAGLTRDELERLLAASTPKHACSGEWSSKWKASYVVAEMDAARTFITEHELVSYDWYGEMTLRCH
ncbi:hypothetical protein HK104_008769 [Borealophlyctis nickersoniae]|nr:hypothetical protein HK104_008769 [Borealophlyctis nickersoniae]